MGRSQGIKVFAGRVLLTITMAAGSLLSTLTFAESIEAGPFWSEVRIAQSDPLAARIQRFEDLFKTQPHAVTDVQSALRDPSHPWHSYALGVAADTRKAEWLHPLIELLPADEESAAAFILAGYMNPKTAEVLSQTAVQWLNNPSLVSKHAATAVQLLKLLALPEAIASSAALSNRTFAYLIQNRSYEVRIQAIQTLESRSRAKSAPPGAGALVSSALVLPPYQLRLAALHAIPALSATERRIASQSLPACEHDKNVLVRTQCKTLRGAREP